MIYGIHTMLKNLAILEYANIIWFIHNKRHENDEQFGKRSSKVCTKDKCLKENGNENGMIIDQEKLDINQQLIKWGDTFSYLGIIVSCNGGTNAISIRNELLRQIKQDWIKKTNNES